VGEWQLRPRFGPIVAINTIGSVVAWLTYCPLPSDVSMMCFITLIKPPTVIYLPLDSINIAQQSGSHARHVHLFPTPHCLDNNTAIDRVKVHPFGWCLHPSLPLPRHSLTSSTMPCLLASPTSTFLPSPHMSR
jgi:hypothetical protein